MSHENVIDCMRRAIIRHIYVYIHDALLSQKFVDVSRDEPNRHLKAQGKQRGVMKSLSHIIKCLVIYNNLHMEHNLIQLL